MGEGASTIQNSVTLTASWGNTLSLTGLAASMVVNALVTGLIVFKILKVSLEVEVTSVERTLGLLSSTGGSKFRHIIFIIIESGMALFAIQLVRLAISSLNQFQVGPTSPGFLIALDIIISVHQILNVIIRSVHFLLFFFFFTDDILPDYQGIAPTIILVRVSMRLSFDDEQSFKESVGSLRFNNPPSDPDSLQGVGSSSSVPPQEKIEDICIDDPLASDPNIILEVRRVQVEGISGSGSAQPQQRSEEY